MSEDTTIITKTGQQTESQAFGISIRGWIVVIITIAVCGNWTANTIMMSLGFTSAAISVPEPIYSVFIAVISYYFGSQKMKGEMNSATIKT